MATRIDITSRLKREKSEIILDDKVYVVRDNKTNVLRVMQLINEKGEDINSVDEALAILLGEEAVADFADFSFQDFLVPFFAVMACVLGKTYEEMEETFRDSVAGI